MSVKYMYICEYMYVCEDSIVTIDDDQITVWLNPNTSKSPWTNGFFFCCCWKLNPVRIKEIIKAFLTSYEIISQ